MVWSSLNERYQQLFFEKILFHGPSLKNTLFCLRTEMNQGLEMRSFVLNKEAKSD